MAFTQIDSHINCDNKWMIIMRSCDHNVTISKEQLGVYTV